MNELLFLLQNFIVIGFAIGIVRFGSGGLISWVVIQAILANLLVLKQIDLWGFHVTASDVFAIGSLLGLNFLQEFFGKKEARTATWICFYFMLFFAVVSQFHLFYIPNEHDTTHTAYQTILSSSPRLFFASLVSFLVSQQLDLLTFGFLKRTLSIHPTLRSWVSLALAQLVDTTLFSFLGLYGLVTSLSHIIFISFCVKCVIVTFMAPSLTLARRFGKIEKQGQPA